MIRERPCELRLADARWANEQETSAIGRFGSVRRRARTRTAFDYGLSAASLTDTPRTQRHLPYGEVSRARLPASGRQGIPGPLKTTAQ